MKKTKRSAPKKITRKSSPKFLGGPTPGDSRKCPQCGRARGSHTLEVWAHCYDKLTREILRPPAVSLDALREEAQQAAQKRAHDKIRWVPPWHGESNSTQYGICQRCGREVLLCMMPQPNETYISGEAVAVNCHRRDA